MKQDEECVQNKSECLREFGSYPFDPENQSLRTLQSGIPASKELIKDFKTAKSDEENQLCSFLEERVFSNDISLYSRILKNE